MLIAGIDHVVLTVADMERTIAFYTRVLGMRLETFGEGRKALRFGEQKFNLQDGRDRTDIMAVARVPTPGSVDLCLLAAVPLDQVVAQLKAQNVPIEIGPVRRTGARFPIRSVYIRDPDGNLIEISEPAGAAAGP
jgi:catechol 2,3-dioxygenase-like lactoylglutathione lyase family enzyme